MRVRVCVLSLVTALAVSATTGLVASPAEAQSSVEARVAERLNATRVRHGLPPLQVRSDLSDYARRHSGAMSSRQALFHTPDFTVLCCWSAVAENVGVGFTVRGVHRALMRSPAHRANILHPDMRALGVGVVRSGGRIWVTQVFRRPR